MSEGVDGLLATMDILEDLLIIDDLLKESGGRGFLDEKVLLASFNRGGLLGSVWEIDDPNSGPTAASCREWGLDGAKILLRICDDEDGSRKTLLDTVKAITELNAVGLPMFLESLPVVKEDDGRHGVYRIVKTAEELARTAGAAAALGDSARYLWLKLPYCENYEMVANSTTLPILLLGGEPVGDATPFLRELAAGLKARPNVRGALVGRNILYPRDDERRARADRPVVSEQHAVVTRGRVADRVGQAFGAGAEVRQHRERRDAHEVVGRERRQRVLGV